jgi:ribosomal protein S18 acetylase RimI-like enzyme
MLVQARAQFTICPASTSEAADIAKLALIASDGLTGITWEAMRRPGETVLDVGTRRAAGRDGSFSYHNAEVAFGRRGVIAAIVSYPMEASDLSSPTPDMPAVFRPLIDLEHHAVSTWYINLLATCSEARGQGAATALIAEVEDRAVYEGYSRLSLIVRDANPARRLYTRVGFREVDRAPMVKADLPLHGTDWIMMVKDIAG